VRFYAGLGLQLKDSKKRLGESRGSLVIGYIGNFNLKMRGTKLREGSYLVTQKMEIVNVSFVETFSWFCSLSCTSTSQCDY
jgi:hypothetical protein